jgi:tetratricopeptide (TPR) repeat protein
MLSNPLPGGTTLYAGHPLIGFHRGENFYDRTLYPPITNRLTEAATPGSVFFWETHYIIPKATAFAVRPFFENRAWRYLGGVTASDSSWAGAYFLRVDPEDTSGVISGAGLVTGNMSEATWRRTTILVQAGIPVARHNASRDPTNEAYWRTLGQRLSTVGLLPEAWKALDRATELDPTNPYNHAYRAEILRFQQDVPGALREAQVALALEPEDGTFLYLNGRLLLDLDRRTDAIPFLIAAADRMTKRWDVQWVAGHSLYVEDRWEEAERFALLVQRLRPQHVESMVLAAEVSLRKGNHEEARGRLSDFIRRIPNEAVPYLLLGDLLQEDGQEAEARAVWTEGLKKTGGDPDIASRLRSLDP